MPYVNPDDIAIFPIKDEHKEVTDKIVDDLARLKMENNGESFIEFGDKNSKLFSHQGVIKGFCGITSIGGVPYIEVFVFGEYRGQGLGPAVTIKIKNKLFEDGYDAVGILVHKNNIRAQESAKKSGFLMIDEDEELNKDNKNDLYYKFIARNYRRMAERRGH